MNSLWSKYFYNISYEQIFSFHIDEGDEEYH